MKITTLLSACALSFFLAGCTAEVEMSTESAAPEGAAETATEAAPDADDHTHADGDDHDH